MKLFRIFSLSIILFTLSVALLSPVVRAQFSGDDFTPGGLLEEVQDSNGTNGNNGGGGLFNSGNSNNPGGGLGNFLETLLGGGDNDNKDGLSPAEVDLFKKGVMESLTDGTLETKVNCAETDFHLDESNYEALGNNALRHSIVFITEGKEKANICFDFLNEKIFVSTTFEADRGEYQDVISERGTVSTQMYFKAIRFIDKADNKKQLTFAEWNTLPANKRDIDFADPRVLPTIEFEYDTYNTEDGTILTKATASLDELEALARLPGILTIIPGTTTLNTNIEYKKQERVRNGTLSASDIRKDSIGTHFTRLRVSDSQIYDGRGVGIQPLEPGKIKGVIQTDDKDKLFKRILNFALSFVGALALGFLVYAGFRFIVGSGNADNATKSRSMILYVVIGIIVIISSYTIVNTFLTLGTETNNNIRVEFRMGSSILLGADLDRNDCMYSGSVSGLFRICYENDLLVIKNPLFNTFYQVPEILGKCESFAIFSVCVSRAQKLDELY